MRSLPKPTFTAEDVFTISISRIQDRGLRARLQACIPVIVRDSADYDVKAAQASLHEIPRSSVVNGNVTRDEMVAVYTGRMVNKNGPGRPYYEKLRHPDGDEDKCPFCGQLPTKTLDHYLAKTDYPSLAVSPNNLVPACRDCNARKSTTYPTRSEDETLHPYFDNIDSERWLFARVRQSSPISLSFFIKSPYSASPLLAQRVKHHFEVFELNTLYKAEAGTELRHISWQMRTLFESGGASAVRRQLLERAESSLQVGLNSWRGAMFDALAHDDWYCSQGVMLK